MSSVSTTSKRRKSLRIEKRNQTGKQQPPIEVDNQEDFEDGEDEQEDVSFRPVKRPSRTSSSSTQKAQIITLTLQCPKCGLMFEDKGKLSKHSKEKHSFGQYRCRVKDCDEYFDNKYILRKHIAQSHHSTTQWLCNKCPKQFISYKQLSCHTIKYHQLGHFQCSFPSCKFTGKNKKKVYDHYAMQHKTQKSRKCQHSGCHFETYQISDLKRHQRAHLGIKPYKCKWSGCDYASVEKSKTLRHICLLHFALDPTFVPNGTQLDPKDYLEVVQ